MGKRNATITAASPVVEFLVLHKSDYDGILKSSQHADRMAALKCLRGIPWFSMWARSRLDRVVSLLQWRYINAGAVIVRQGDPPDNVYFVLEGTCVVTKDIVLTSKNRWPTGKRAWKEKTCTAVRPFKLVELGPGKYFGEKAIIEETVRAATVSAQTDCVLLSLDKIVFCELLNRGTENSKIKADEKTESYPSDAEIISLIAGIAGGGGPPRKPPDQPPKPQDSLDSEGSDCDGSEGVMQELEARRVRGSHFFDDVADAVHRTETCAGQVTEGSESGSSANNLALLSIANRQGRLAKHTKFRRIALQNVGDSGLARSNSDNFGR